MPQNRKPKPIESIGWAQPLSSPVRRRDGTTLTTLMDAADYLLGLPVERQATPVALGLHERLITAHVSGDPRDIMDATRQLKTLIEAEGPRG